MGAAIYLVAVRWLVQVCCFQEIHQNFLPFHQLKVTETFGLIETREQSLNSHSPQVIHRLIFILDSHIVGVISCDRLLSIIVFRWIYIHLFKMRAPCICVIFCQSWSTLWQVGSQLPAHCWVGLSWGFSLPS